MLRVPAAKNALVASLKANPALEGVHIQRGLPADMPADDDRVYVTNTPTLRREPAEPGGPRQERFTVQLVIETTVISGDDEDGHNQSELRFWQVAAAIDATLDGNSELDGTVWSAELTAVDDQVTFPIENGWATRAGATVTCESYI